MTNVGGATSGIVPAQSLYQTNAGLAHHPAAMSAYAHGDQWQATATTAPSGKKTLAEMLADVGQVKEGSSLIARVWNWMNKPKVEAVREFGGSLLVNAPSLFIEFSKKSAASAAGTAVAGSAAAIGTESLGATVGNISRAAGNTGLMAVLSKVGAVTGTVGGVVQLLRDMVQAEVDPPGKLEKGLLLGGGFLAATGSVIALCGAGFPGAVIGLIGTLAHASGLWAKANRIGD